MIRRIIFVSAVLALIIPFTCALAQNEMSSAVMLSLNGSSRGSMSSAQNNYWWKVILVTDGHLEIATSSSSGLDVDLSIFDENGRYLSGNVIGSGTSELSRLSNAGAGTYYIKALKAL